MNPAGFEVSDSCIGCGLCIKVCPGGVLFMGPDKRPHIRDFQEFGWNGCWQCDHCLSVCPKGAVRIGIPAGDFSSAMSRPGRSGT